MAKQSVQHRVRADCAARPHPAQACCLQRTAACAAVQDRRLCRKTALILAAYHKHAEAVTLLVKAGADQSIKDQEGCAQLHCGVDQALVFASSFHPQNLAFSCLNPTRSGLSFVRACFALERHCACSQLRLPNRRWWCTMQEDSKSYSREERLVEGIRCRRRLRRRRMSTAAIVRTRSRSTDAPDGLLWCWTSDTSVGRSCRSRPSEWRGLGAQHRDTMRVRGSEQCARDARRCGTAHAGAGAQTRT
jgi:hypothetical protein